MTEARFTNAGIIGRESAYMKIILPHLAALLRDSYPDEESHNYCMEWMHVWCNRYSEHPDRRR